MNHSQLFQGGWVGRSMGGDSPAHIWEIDVGPNVITLKTRWENKTQTHGLLAQVVPDQPAFDLGDDRIATLLDSQHFVIPKWDTNDIRDRKGPAYDVIFSRPGLAELTAGQVYKGWQKANKKKRRQP